MQKTQKNYLQINKRLVLANNNQKEAHSLVKEIFEKHIYYTDTNLDKPRIFDVGAHIGISSLYFKSLYPDAQILAFEPNPDLQEILKENIELNHLDDIKIISMAISNFEGIGDLYIDKTGDEWHSNSSLIPGGWTEKEILEPIKVKTTRLISYLSQPIDILKIDSEGNEWLILKDLEQKFDQINEIFVEYHPGKVSLKQVKDLLQEHKFKTRINASTRHTGLRIIHAHR